MASVYMLKGAVVTGNVVANPGETHSVGLTLALQLISNGQARFSSVAASQHLRNTDLASITSLTGDGLASLDTVEIAGETTGKDLRIYLSSETNPRTYRITAKGSYTPDGDTIISPPDFDSVANNRVLLRTQ